MKLHSEVGLITNSSTTIFSTATDNSIGAFKKLIDQVMILAGSDKTCDEMFDVSLVLDDDYLEIIADSLSSYLHSHGEFPANAKIMKAFTPEELVVMTDAIDGPTPKIWEALVPVLRKIGDNKDLADLVGVDESYQDRLTYSLHVIDKATGKVVNAQTLLNSVESHEVDS